jgi:hypothetical protein
LHLARLLADQDGSAAAEWFHVPRVRRYQFQDSAFDLNAALAAEPGERGAEFSVLVMHFDSFL